MNKEDLKKSLFKRVERYNINDKELNKIFNKIYNEDSSENMINKSFDIETEKYMIKQIKKGETRYQSEIIKANAFLKIMFQKDKIHSVDVEFLDELYNRAVEIAIEEYNDKQTINILILKYMKKLSVEYRYKTSKEHVPVKTYSKENEQIILSKQEPANNITKVKSIDNKTLSIQIIESNDDIIDNYNRINASFLNLLILNKKMSKLDLAMNLRTNIDMLNKILNGEHTITDDKLKNLYNKYNASDAYDLKKKNCNCLWL